jgi:UDP-2,3-diacylglucosamine pyrophosphatase LpxH
MKVVKYLMELIGQGVKVHYVTGNHDEMLRKFVGFELGSFAITNKLILNLHGKKAWIFHGDVFDVTMQHSKWIAKLGAVGYDFLILLNRGINFCYKKFGKGHVSMSKKIKNGVKSAVKFINNFEKVAADIAIDNEFDYVICGHIHQPEIKTIETTKGKVVYLNSGDWIENLTALEYHRGKWKLYRYEDDIVTKAYDIEINDPVEVLEKNQLFQSLMEEFNTLTTIKRTK